MKINADHLRRDAFVYVRQSTQRQVFENTESTKRQYALRDRAVAMGWPMERGHVIDNDLGLSGAQARDRDGFQHLVTEVAMGHAGIVLGLEVSRLARNNADWQRLLELAAMSRTIISDEDGVYDPAHFNDRIYSLMSTRFYDFDGRSERAEAVLASVAPFEGRARAERRLPLARRRLTNPSRTHGCSAAAH
ncbi:recombinase family protein [Variovorax sp. dw_308]|uniref:recombinase family protein n=1 Tax=Variovorax sp. dw_308 TaxID=2721546 RepID=UPI00210C9E16|nr:recombinase family protein [Variovorax sp. dw_308]